MKWVVYRYNINAQEIQPYDIFRHAGFASNVKKAARMSVDKGAFSGLLRRELFYYFDHKAEWEVVVAPWTGASEDRAVLVDVCAQVRLNWDVFVDYVWTQEKGTTNEIY